MLNIELSHRHDKIKKEVREAEDQSKKLKRA